MKLPAARKVFRFSLWSAAALVTLAILLYIEEDWRGSSAWAKTKARWEAKGETFDYSKFIPPPIPDDQNLAALPLFELEPGKLKDYVGNPEMEPIALLQAMHHEELSTSRPHLPDWHKGDLPDMDAIRKTVATNYSTVFKDAKPDLDSSAQFNATYPFLPALIADSSSRARFRLNIDYAPSNPIFRNYGMLTRQIELSQIVTLHALLSLNTGQSDPALNDIKLNFQILSGVKNDPTYVGGLVALGMATITNGALFDGLALHAWTDAQLVELEHVYQPINFLADFQYAERSEAAQVNTNVTYFKHASRSELINITRYAETASSSIMVLRYRLPWPNGWWDTNTRQFADYHFSELATVDPQAHRAFPHLQSQINEKITNSADKWDADAPWNFWFSLAAPSERDMMQRYAHAQVWNDEALIACALERYRLAKGVYPNSLADVAPAYIDEIPNDIMTGEPYHYRLGTDGQYLLYSIGWNLKDDGGTIAFKKDSPKSKDDDEGDWVWPTANKVTTTP